MGWKDKTIHGIIFSVYPGQWLPNKGFEIRGPFGSIPIPRSSRGSSRVGQTSD